MRVGSRNPTVIRAIALSDARDEETHRLGLSAATSAACLLTSGSTGCLLRNQHKRAEHHDRDRRKND
jgi:hypothetical protein